MELAVVEELGKLGTQVHLGSLHLNTLHIGFDTPVTAIVVVPKGAALSAEAGDLANLLGFDISIVADIKADSGADGLVSLRQTVQSIALIVVVLVSVIAILLGLGLCLRLRDLGGRRSCWAEVGKGGLGGPLVRLVGVEDIITQSESRRGEIEVALRRRVVAGLVLGPFHWGVVGSGNTVRWIAQIVVRRGVGI